MWTMPAFSKSPSTMPGDLAGDRLTRPEGLLKCESILVISTPPGTYVKHPSLGCVSSEQALKTVLYLAYDRKEETNTSWKF